MSEDFNVIGYYLTSNADMELHEQEQLEHLVKKKVINKNILDYNKKVSFIRYSLASIYRKWEWTIDKRKDLSKEIKS